MVTITINALLLSYFVAAIAVAKHRRQPAILHVSIIPVTLLMAVYFTFTGEVGIAAIFLAMLIAAAAHSKDYLFLIFCRQEKVTSGNSKGFSE